MLAFGSPSARLTFACIICTNAKNWHPLVQPVLKKFLPKLLLSPHVHLSNQPMFCRFNRRLPSVHPALKFFLHLIVVAILPCTNPSCNTYLSSFFVSCFTKTCVPSMGPKIIHLTNLLTPKDHVVRQSPKSHSYGLNGAMFLTAASPPHRGEMVAVWYQPLGSWCMPLSAVAVDVSQ